MGNKKGVIIGICGVGVIIISLIIYILFNQNTTVEEPQNIQSTELPIVTEPVLTPETPTQEPYQYIDANGNTLEKRVLTPDGFNRLQAPEGGFANFLRNYELKEDGAPILMYDGRVKSNQESHIAVFNMRISNKDLQQCADSVIRLYAEYFYETEQYDRMQFHFVNGFNCDYPSWQSGKRVSISGNNVNWVSSAGYDNSYDSFEKYLAMVFAYASTLSMDTEASEITLEEMQIGDVFLTGGSPGHVVMIVDMCEDVEGERAFLLAQGYMPAQEFHILNNPASEEDPWYYVSDVTYPFQTSGYTFSEGTLKRLQYSY